MKCDFTSQLHPYTPLIRHIPHFLLEDWIIYFEHIPSADNECVNWFIKIVISSNDALKIWNSCPLNLSRDGRCCKCCLFMSLVSLNFPFFFLFILFYFPSHKKYICAGPYGTNIFLFV